MGRLWDADAALVPLVPGGLHKDAAPNTVTARPYAILTVKPGTREFFSLGEVQHYMARIEVRSAAGATNAGVIAEAVMRTYQRSEFKRLELGVLKILDAIPQPGAMDTEARQYQGQDVTLTAFQWDVVVHHYE